MINREVTNKQGTPTLRHEIMIGQKPFSELEILNNSLNLSNLNKINTNNL